MVVAGPIVGTAFISPFRTVRDMARSAGKRRASHRHDESLAGDRSDLVVTFLGERGVGDAGERRPCRSDE
jgi:hypothetical protein